MNLIFILSGFLILFNRIECDLDLDNIDAYIDNNGYIVYCPCMG